MREGFNPRLAQHPFQSVQVGQIIKEPVEQQMRRFRETRAPRQLA